MLLEQVFSLLPLLKQHRYWLTVVVRVSHGILELIFSQNNCGIKVGWCISDVQTSGNQTGHKTLFGLRNLTFVLGGSYFYNFLIRSFGDIQGYIDQKIAILKSITLNPLLRSKYFRSMTTPNVRFLRPNKVLMAQKKFLGPPKHKKLIFSKNWNYMIWLHTLGDSHSTQLQGPIGHISGEFI